MKRQVRLVNKCLISAVVGGIALASTGTLTMAADMPVKADVETTPPGWWFHGSVEAGGRFFLNNPSRGNQTANGPSTCGPTANAQCPGVAGNSLAGYYQYSDNAPGPFSNIWLSTGSYDGLYQIDVGGNNIGYKDQSYYLNASKAGQQYFNFQYDQSPHLYSTSALSVYQLNGTRDVLPALSAASIAALKTAAFSSSSAPILAPYAQPTDIGISRDTAAAQYRWTPTDAWDVQADYSHLARNGTQVTSMTAGLINNTQLIKPVDDTTQIYGANGEWNGIAPWGKRLVVKAGYSGSTYTDNLTSFSWQNASQVVGAAPGGADALWPSNQANTGYGNVMADLPWQSRYVGNYSFTQNTQNASFTPASANFNYPLMPASSLNGEINTTMLNNVITTKITPTISNKLSYRYYDTQNGTPELHFTNVPVRDETTTGSINVNSLSMSYTRQNFGEEVNWRPTKEWNFGANYGFERYDWTRADATSTTENTGKVFADWKPNTWFTVRSSASYGDRQPNNYNYLNNVGIFQWGSPTSGDLYSPAYQQLMIDKRQTFKANVLADIVVVKGLTITPSVKYQDENYGIDPTQSMGLSDSQKWAAGLDIAYQLSLRTSVTFGYVYEIGKQLLYSNTAAGVTVLPPFAAGSTVLTNETMQVNTFTAAIQHEAIPDKLNLDLRYTASFGSDELYVSPNGAVGSTSGALNSNLGGQFPTNTTWFQRLDATATYKFDKETVAKAGFKGDLKAKLRYSYERNAESNWANDGLLPFTGINPVNQGPFGVATGVDPWLAWYNPNYTVHMLSASLIATW